jgi:hypothetical protein
MDYSAAADEHGSSPWATSPQNSRFLPTDSAQPDVPPSPLPPGAQYSEPSDSRPTTADSEAERFTGKAPVPSSPSENGEGGSRQQQDAVEGGPAVPATQPRNQSGARYKGQQREKRPQPQYKLTAKVTALERNGRKDPVVRFDVYVWPPPTLQPHSHCYILTYI